MTDGTAAGTNGGGLGTSGSVWPARLLVAAVPLGLAAQISINALTRIADAAAEGISIAPGRAWGYELSSGAAILLLLPALWWVTGHACVSRLGWPRTIAAHVVASIVFSAVHIALMLAFRAMAWGHAYYPGRPIDIFLYEYRKDAMSYALMVAFFALARWVGANAAAPPRPEPVAPSPAILRVPDGATTHHVPVDEIDLVTAAGNYVELAWGPRTLLHRATLAAVEHELGDRFARIHRGRLVRRDAVRTIETNQAGDFEVVLAGGVRAKGSRRYRDTLVAPRL